MSQANKKETIGRKPVKILTSETPFSRDKDFQTHYSNFASVLTGEDEVQLIFTQKTVAPDGEGNRVSVSVDVGSIFMARAAALRLANAIQAGEDAQARDADSQK